MQNSKYLIPNSITLTSLVFGVVGIIVSIEGRIMQSPDKFTIAAWCIAISAICDFLDGFVARLTKTCSLFGMQFDSLCDLVAFGVAPSVITYNYILNDYKTKGLMMSAIFVGCGAVRLARFNVMALNKQDMKLSLGLPIPLAAVQIISMILYFQSISLPMNQQRNLLAAFTIYLSIAMVSNFEYVSNKMFPKSKESKMIFGGIVIAELILLFVNFYCTVFYSILIYCLSGPIVSGYKFLHNEDLKNSNKGKKLSSSNK